MILTKRIITTLSIIFFAQSVYASEEVYLDINPTEIHRFDTGELQYENSKKNDDEDEVENYIKPSFKTMKKMFDEDFYKTKTITTTKEKDFGKNTIGTKYDTTLNTDSTNKTRTIFAKRKLTEKISVDSSYKSDLGGGLNTQAKGTASVAPEYKFNSKTSLKNVYSTNLGDKSNKTEVQLNYKPFKDGRMDLNVGAGQKAYDNGQQSSSQINFGTNIRF